MYVYAHKNLKNGKYYIGKTKNPNERWKNNGSNYKKCKCFYSAIQKYGWDNFEHIILEENLNDQEASLKEKEYIKKYNSLSPNGYNLSEGGTGGNTWIGKSQEEKEKFSQERKEETLNRSKDWHKKLSKSIEKSWELGLRSREEARDRMLGKNNIMSKPCVCIETGKRYESYADAAEDCGYDRKMGSKIGEVILGKRKTACKKHWRKG